MMKYDGRERFQGGCGRKTVCSFKGMNRAVRPAEIGHFVFIGKTDDAKASEKGKTPAKGTGIQRSPSDAGKSSGDEGKKPPSGVARPPTTGSFGFKKVGGPSGALITGSGATLAGSSATLGKLPKTSALGKGGAASAGNGARKTSLDEAQPQDDGALLSMATSRTPLQYRSLPRPAKSSASGIVGRASHRSSSSSVDSNVSGKSAPAPKRRDAGKAECDRSSPVTVNQTDKEKVAGSDSEGTGLTPKSSPTSTGQSGLRLPGPKYPDIASPTFRRSDPQCTLLPAVGYERMCYSPEADYEYLISVILTGHITLQLSPIADKGYYSSLVGITSFITQNQRL